MFKEFILIATHFLLFCPFYYFSSHAVFFPFLFLSFFPGSTLVMYIAKHFLGTSLKCFFFLFLSSCVNKFECLNKFKTVTMPWSLYFIGPRYIVGFNLFTTFSYNLRSCFLLTANDQKTDLPCQRNKFVKLLL